MGGSEKSPGVASGLRSLVAVFLGLKRVRENSVVPPGLVSNLPFYPALKRCAKRSPLRCCILLCLVPPDCAKTSSHAHTEALRHPKSRAKSSFSATCEAVRCLKPIYETRSSNHRAGRITRRRLGGRFFCSATGLAPSRRRSAPGSRARGPGAVSYTPLT